MHHYGANYQAGKQKSTAQSKRQRVLRAASLWALSLIGFIALRLIYSSYGIGIPCPLYVVTGLYCPGCGMFRAAGALIQGDIWQAIRYNALSVILLPTLMVLCIRETARYIRAANPIRAKRLETAIYTGAITISVLYAIARNLPIFAMLQPTNL